MLDSTPPGGSSGCKCLRSRKIHKTYPVNHFSLRSPSIQPGSGSESETFGICIPTARTHLFNSGRASRFDESGSSSAASSNVRWGSGAQRSVPTVVPTLFVTDGSFSAVQMRNLARAITSQSSSQTDPNYFFLYFSSTAK